MSIEMEIPKVLWLKSNMPKELFDRCKFYDLTDALTHLATGNEKRSFCSVVCKQGYVPVGVDGSVKGWQPDFLNEIGLEELTEDSFKRIGGVNGQVGFCVPSFVILNIYTFTESKSHAQLITLYRMENISLLENSLGLYVIRQPQN